MLRPPCRIRRVSLFVSFLLLVGVIFNLPPLKNLGAIDGSSLLSFASASSSNYLNTTVHSGDLIIQQNETLVIRDAKYVVEGNIQIYGNLTVENSELLIKYDPSQYRDLHCFSSGNLTAINSTIGYEGEPEWYTTPWYVEGKTCLRSVKSPEINWHVPSHCKAFLVENSLANEIFILANIISNNSIVIEHGQLINDSGIEIPDKVSFIGNNTVRTQFVFGVWCHQYSNLTIKDTSAFTFGNTTNFLVAGSRIEAKIQIFMYEHALAYIENSTIFISFLHQNSTVNFKYSTVEEVNCYDNSTLFVKCSHMDLIHLYDYSYLFAENSTLGIVNLYHNVSAEIYYTNSSHIIRVLHNSSLIVGPGCRIIQLDVFYHVYGYVYVNVSSIYMENVTKPSLHVLDNVEIIHLFKIFNLFDNASGSFVNTDIHGIVCYDRSVAYASNVEINFVHLYGNSKATITGSTVHCDVSLYENSNMTIRDSSCNNVYCYGFGTLSITNSTLNYISIDERASVLLANSKITSIDCRQGSVDVISSNVDCINLYDNSYLFTDNSTYSSVCAYSSSSVYFVNSTVGYFYTDYNVTVTLVDTFVYSSSFSDPSSVELIDTQSPIILSISYSPSFPREGETITFIVKIRDMSIAEVFLLYSLDNVSWDQVSMVKVSSDSFSVTIGPFPANSTLFYKIVAKDQGGRTTESPVYTIFIKGLGALPGEPGEGESAGVSPSGVQPSGGLFSVFLSAILLLTILLVSSVLYVAVKSRTATVGERIFKSRLAREEKTSLQQIRSLIFSEDYESAYDVIRSVYTIDTVDDVLEEVPLAARIKFSSWLLNRLLEEGFYDQAVKVASKVKDFKQLRAIYLGIAMKKLAEGDKKGAIGFFEKAIEVSEKMGDKKSAKAIRKNLRKIY